MNLQKITLNGKRCTTISMDKFYPFGGIVETPDDDEQCLVIKKLYYEQEEDLQMIQQMASLIRGLDNEFLIQIIEIDASQPNTCQLYYEYVPLTIDKWVLDMGQELIKELHFQLLNLASFLSHKGFRFTFNPHCVGLSQDIKVKYFLNEFAIDKENKLFNYKENEKLINNFFDDLIVPEKGNIQEMTRQTISSNGIESSMFIRESWDSRSWKSSGSGKGNTQKKITEKVNLLERLEDSKKRSLEVIQRLKSSKLKLK